MAKKEKPPKEKKPKKVKEKKEKVKKEKVRKPKENKKQSLLSKPEGDDTGVETTPKKGKKKLLIMGGVILVVLLAVAGGVFFLIQSGILAGFFGSSEEATIDKPQVYTDGLAYYQAGSYYDAKAAFGLLEGYQDSKEMAEKINLDTIYPSNGAKIAEYIGSDTVNNYLLAYPIFEEIDTTLGKTDTTQETSGETSGEAVQSKSSEASSETESSSASSSEGEQKEEKIEYDETVKEAIKEKTTAIIEAGSPILYLELGENNILYPSNEALKRSAEASIEAAKKIREGVEDGSYKPGGTSETATEIKTLLDTMESETETFRNQIDTIIGANGLEMLKYSNSGNCMKRYSQTLVVFYNY